MINGINFNLNHHHTILNLNNKKEDEKFSNNTMTENSIYRGEKFEFNSKIFGLDKSISKKDMKKFNNFMKSNAVGGKIKCNHRKIK
ncbi:hypothetical protein BSJ29_05535 [Campylobacter jejuni]|nr:hypothetical protein [Campylobacter jejuni]